MSTATLLLTALVLVGAVARPTLADYAPSHLESNSAAPRPPVDVTLYTRSIAKSDRPRTVSSNIQRIANEQLSAVAAPQQPSSPAKSSVSPRALLREHWGSNPELQEGSPNRITGIAITGAVMLVAACGLLWCWKRLGTGWGPVSDSSPALLLRATLPLRPGVSLHLLRTVDSDVLVAVDQRGLQSVTLLRSQFDLPADDDSDSPESDAVDTFASRSRSLVQSSPFPDNLAPHALTPRTVRN
ncbi:MAG: hypothetical protein ACK5Q5_16305 [Planctomycetaceae bacterium]